MSDYNLILTDQAGNELAKLDDVVEFEVSLRTNAVGWFDARFKYSDALWDVIRPDHRIEVWRKPTGGTQYYLVGETAWLIEKYGQRWNRGQHYLTVGASSANVLLRRRYVLYAAGSSQASKSGSPDEMMTAIIRENLGDEASADRDLSYWLSIGTPLGDMTSVSQSFSRRRVDRLLSDLAQAAAQNGERLYYGLVYLPRQRRFEFRTYRGQGGRDRTLNSAVGAVILSPDAPWGNLDNVVYEIDHRDEITVCEAAGAGQGADRSVQTYSDDDRLLSRYFGRIESVRDARHLTDAAGLLTEAQIEVWDGRPRQRIDGQIVETPALRLGLEYNHGDKVTAIVASQQVDCRIEAVSVRVSDGETIDARIEADD